MLRTVLVSSDSNNMTTEWVVAEEHHRITKFGGNATAFFAKARKNRSQQSNGKSDPNRSYDPSKKMLL